MSGCYEHGLKQTNADQTPQALSCLCSSNQLEQRNLLNLYITQDHHPHQRRARTPLRGALQNSRRPDAKSSSTWRKSLTPTRSKRFSCRRTSDKSDKWIGIHALRKDRQLPIWVCAFCLLGNLVHSPPGGSLLNIRAICSHVLQMGRSTHLRQKEPKVAGKLKFRWICWFVG